MIQRIRPTEYLTDIQVMTEGERKEYLKRVGEWLAGGGKRLLQMTDRPMAQAQNIVQLSARWGKDDCEAFRHGTLLLTALMKVSDTWMPSQLYVKSANRAVRHIVECFSTCNIEHVKNSGGVAAHNSRYPKSTAGAKPAQNGDTHLKDKKVQIVVVNNDSTKRRPVASQVPSLQPSSKGKDNAAPAFNPSTAVVPRPNHIDQYVHLLPKKTQERAMQYGPLMRDLGAARENMRLLMDSPDASDKAREQWAKLATKIDAQVKSIRLELDREWENLVKKGRVVVDDLGMAHILDGEQSEDAGDKAAGDQKPDANQEAKRKAALLRKFLIDRRNAKTEEQQQKWIAKYREMIALAGEDAVTDKVRETAEHYEIDLTQIANQ